MQIAVTQPIYDALVAAFRIYPGNAKQAAKHAGTGWQLARTGWTLGWPRKGMLPISMVIDTEQASARALRIETEAQRLLVAARIAAERTQQETEVLIQEKMQGAEELVRRRIEELSNLAGLDMAEQRADEATLSRYARKNCSDAQQMIAQLLQGARRWSETVVAATAAGELTVPQCMMMIRHTARVLRETNEASRLAVQLERLRVGDPTDVVSIQVDTGNMDEAARDIEHAHNLLELARARGVVSTTVPADPAPSPDKPN